MAQERQWAFRLLRAIPNVIATVARLTSKPAVKISAPIITPETRSKQHRAATDPVTASARRDALAALQGGSRHGRDFDAGASDPMSTRSSPQAAKPGAGRPPGDIPTLMRQARVPLEGRDAPGARASLSRSLLDKAQPEAVVARRKSGMLVEPSNAAQDGLAPSTLGRRKTPLETAGLGIAAKPVALGLSSAPPSAGQSDGTTGLKRRNAMVRARGPNSQMVGTAQAVAYRIGGKAKIVEINASGKGIASGSGNVKTASAHEAMLPSSREGEGRAGVAKADHRRLMERSRDDTSHSR